MPRYALDRSWVSPRAGSGRGGEEKNSQPLPEIRRHKSVTRKIENFGKFALLFIWGKFFGHRFTVPIL
jgi:hypothetical protein